VPAGGWESAPGCIQHGVAAKPYPNVYAAYEKCASVGGDFFTFGHGSKLGTFADGVNSSYWVLTALGFSVMVGFLIWWVVLEDRKLKLQSEHLRSAGISSAIHTSESR
jgi:hypothetical protein